MLVAPTPGLPLADPARYVQILRWIFRRGDESVVCELGLTSYSSAYELRVLPCSNPAGATAEQFDDALTAFRRHGTIERSLITQGWSLDRFESDRVLRTDDAIVADP